MEAIEWVTPLKAAAAFFIYHVSKLIGSFEKKLGEKAAEAFWEKRAEIKNKLKETAAAPLRKVASAISKARRASTNQTYVRIGLPIPDDYFGSMLSVEGDDEVTIAMTLAMFVMKAEEIEEAIKRESEKGEIFGGVELKLDPEGGFIAMWYDKDSKMHKIKIS